MPHDARALANFVLDYATKKGVPVSNMALNKLLYFCHAGFLAERGEPLVQQSFEAWEHGPVLQDIYQQFKQHKDGPIQTRANKLDASTAKYVEVGYELAPVDSELIVKILNFYIRFSASELREISHEVGGPWYQAWHHLESSNPGMTIPNDRIGAHFRNPLRANRSTEN